YDVAFADLGGAGVGGAAGRRQAAAGTVAAGAAGECKHARRGGKAGEEPGGYAHDRTSYSLPIPCAGRPQRGCETREVGLLCGQEVKLTLGTRPLWAPSRFGTGQGAEVNGARSVPFPAPAAG